MHGRRYRIRSKTAYGTAPPGAKFIVLGFPHDVAIASELDDSDTVPVLEDRVFRAQRTGRRLNKLRAQR